MHDSQALEPTTSAYWPGLHVVGVVARVKHELPTRQLAQAVLPLAHWYLPASHAVQMLAPLLAVIVPGSHVVAIVAPVGQAEPAGHDVQSLGEVAPAELR